MHRPRIFMAALLALCGVCGFSQQFVPIDDESKVPTYTLPDPLIFENGTPVGDVAAWHRRRNELLKIFESEEYGVSPAWHGKISATEQASNPDAFQGLGVMKQVKLTLINGNKQHTLNLLIYLPKKTGKIPVFLGYNFNGNYTVTDDPLIVAENIWEIEGDKVQQVKAADSDRGTSYNNWQVKEILSRGYGLVTLYYCDVDPDFDDGFKNGIHSLYDQKIDSSSWGSIAAWAWGLSRVLDYLETVPQIDSKRVMVMGHSRLGKAALWAGATDQRFALVISNNSGCGGAALSKRIFGETVGRINSVFPHWFCDNYNKYNEKEELLPVDQHELLALIAPRPLYVASAEEDKWADPKGEFLSCVAATPVYRLLGKEGLPVTEIPAVNSPVAGTIGYHIRSGGHDVKLYDWQRYLDFADKFFSR